MNNYAVLIPSKKRPTSLAKLLKACPSLNRPTTYLGIDITGFQKVTTDYVNVIERLAPKANVLPIKNPGGYTSVAREYLRHATKDQYERYVLADDNCVFDDTSLAKLTHAQNAWDCVMAGGHPTARHFHSDRIAETTEMKDGVSSYEQVGMIYWCIPNRLYGQFTYPTDCYFDDVYFILWAMTKGFTNFRSTLDAPFNKHLHEPGGTGTVSERIRKRGVGFARLATDFPQWMTTDILSTRVPYRRIIKAVAAGKGGL